MFWMSESIYLGEGERIDVRLTNKFGYSRNFFHHLIQRGGIKVNDKIVKKSYKLKNNDQILVENLQRHLSPLVLEESPKIDIPIVLEKEDYLVVNKPKGVLSHPKNLWEINNPSVVGFLYHKFKELPSVGNFIRAGLIHRLDVGTDGLMIIAKTEKGLKYFKNLFNQKSDLKEIKDKEKVELKKFYRAICYLKSDGEIFFDGIKDKLPYYIQEIVKPKIPYYIPKIGITKIMSIERLKIKDGKGKNCKIGYGNFNMKNSSNKISFKL